MGFELMARIAAEEVKLLESQNLYEATRNEHALYSRHILQLRVGPCEASIFLSSFRFRCCCCSCCCSSFAALTGGGGFFLACEDFGKMFDNSFSACPFLFLCFCFLFLFLFFFS